MKKNIWFKLEDQFMWPFFSLACAGYNLIKSISKKQFQSAVYIYFLNKYYMK